MKTKEVDIYINKQKSPQKEILKKIRNLILKTLPGCEEKMRWGVPTFAGGKFYIVALKKHVHLGFSVSGLEKKELELFEGSGKTMRHIKISSLKEFDEKTLTKLLKLVNRKAVCKP